LSIEAGDYAAVLTSMRTNHQQLAVGLHQSAA
jgi:hypothetical protein